MVEAKDVLAAIPPLRGAVVETEEDILAAMGGVLEGVKPGRKSLCCRKGEGNFDANAAATASATHLLISASCFFTSCVNCLSCLSWASSSLVWRSCMAWLWFSNEISSVCAECLSTGFIGLSGNDNPARDFIGPPSVLDWLENFIGSSSEIPVREFCLWPTECTCAV